MRCSGAACRIRASITNTLLYAAPLLLVGVGTCVSTRAGIFNIGQEGQVLVGALGAAWVALRFAIPGPLLAILVFVGGAVGGGFWAGLSALMHRLRGVNIVVSTLLMTFLAQQLISYAVETSWFLQQSRNGRAYRRPQVQPDPGQRPAADPSATTRTCRSTAGSSSRPWHGRHRGGAQPRTRWGFRVKHARPEPGQPRGTPGCASRRWAAPRSCSPARRRRRRRGAPGQPDRHHPARADASNNIGWDGLLVALVARNRPLLCAPVAVLFGILRAGGSFLAATGVPYYLVDVVKGLLVLALVVPSVASVAARQRWATGRLPAARPELSTDTEEVRV